MRQSHPAWVCGLKLKKVSGATEDGVTPCVGVWIETEMAVRMDITRLVTPCVGVWIETDKGVDAIKEAKSHPAWVCGLKHYLLK